MVEATRDMYINSINNGQIIMECSYLYYNLLGGKNLHPDDFKNMFNKYFVSLSTSMKNRVNDRIIKVLDYHFSVNYVYTLDRRTLIKRY